MYAFVLFFWIAVGAHFVTGPFEVKPDISILTNSLNFHLSLSYVNKISLFMNKAKKTELIFQVLLFVEYGKTK